MKYSEFEKEVESLGLIISDFEDSVMVFNPEAEGNLVMVSKKKFADIITGGFDKLDLISARTLLRLAVELAGTLLEEREDDKKYNVVAYETYEGPKGGRLHKMFYYRNSDYTLGAMIESRNDDENQQWTLQQIREWGLEDCERIEVKE